MTGRRPPEYDRLPGRAAMSWTAGLSPSAAAALKQAATATASADEVPPLSGHLLEAVEAGTDNYLLVTADDAVVGAAVAHCGDPVELFVTPGHRRRGLGSELVRAGLERTGAVWAHGDLPPARAVAAGLGLSKVRELLQMRRGINRDQAAAQLAGISLPTGVHLRTFVPGQDEAQFLSVNARAFDWHPEQGRLDLAGLRVEMAQPWFDPAGFFLAVDQNDTVLGFHWTKVHTPEKPAAGDSPGGADDLGEIYVIGVDPIAAVGGNPVRGLGSPLTAIGLDHLARLGIETVLLYVEGDNTRALTLYRRLGFEVFATDVVYRRKG